MNYLLKIMNKHYDILLSSLHGRLENYCSLFGQRRDKSPANTNTSKPSSLDYSQDRKTKSTLNFIAFLKLKSQTESIHLYYIHCLLDINSVPSVYIAELFVTDTHLNTPPLRQRNMYIWAGMVK